MYYIIFGSKLSWQLFLEFFQSANMSKKNVINNNVKEKKDARERLSLEICIYAGYCKKIGHENPGNIF